MTVSTGIPRTAENVAVGDHHLQLAAAGAQQVHSAVIRPIAPAPPRMTMRGFIRSCLMCHYATSARHDSSTVSPSLSSASVMVSGISVRMTLPYRPAERSSKPRAAASARTRSVRAGSGLSDLRSSTSLDRAHRAHTASFGDEGITVRHSARSAWPRSRRSLRRDPTSPSCSMCFDGAECRGAGHGVAAECPAQSAGLCRVHDRLRARRPLKAGSRSTVISPGT